MPKPSKLTRQELIEKIRDLDVSDEEISAYFMLDEEQGDAFSPAVIPNPDLLVDDELEGAFFLNSFNRLARARRNRKYRRRIKNWDGIKIVAEGDSWFQYPLLLKDTIDQLSDTDHFQYAIYGLSEAGDLLSSIIDEDEITEALERENPDVFLISGGGNDMVGDGRAATLVHRYKANRAAVDYPNENFDAFLAELDRLYRGLFTRQLALRPHLKIVCHGYDHAIPANGTWLGKPLRKQGITRRKLQQQIVAEMIRRFNGVMAKLAADFPGSVYHVDCQTIVGPEPQWHDELHPKNDGYFRVAQKFDEVIRRALSDNAASQAINLSAVTDGDSAGAPGSEVARQPITLAKMQKLGNQDFLNLVVSRAEKTIGGDIPMPKTEYERKQLEADISRHFEKIHKEANFLPSSFLEQGVTRAQSVCRIVTDTSYGSGFLIAARSFLMTNNHVLPDADTAAVSNAQFDYDEDDILYEVELRPEQFFLTNEALDFTIVACDPNPLPADIIAIPLLRDVDTVTRGERVNIIQHPAGRRKEISLHDNKVSYVYDIGLRYTADTEGGSSGSPVFNNQWELVGLHHAGWSGADGTATNEGIRIAAIVNFLENENAVESASAENPDGVLGELLELVCEACEVEGGAAAPGSGAAPVTAASSAASSYSRRSKKAGAGKHLALNIEGELEEITIRIR